MVGPGRSVKMAAGAEATMKETNCSSNSSNNSSSSSRQHSTEVLHQRRKMPHCPMRMAIGGFAATVVLGYLVLYSHKKPEASALDVAKVATGVAHPENTRPRN